MVDKTCPNCLSLVPAFNDHCYTCGYDFPDVAPETLARCNSHLRA